MVVRERYLLMVSSRRRDCEWPRSQIGVGALFMNERMHEWPRTDRRIRMKWFHASHIKKKRTFDAGRCAIVQHLSAFIHYIAIHVCCFCAIHGRTDRRTIVCVQLLGSLCHLVAGSPDNGSTTPVCLSSIHIVATSVSIYTAFRNAW